MEALDGLTDQVLFVFVSRKLAFIANRKNLSQHIVILDWSQDGNKNEPAIVELLNDAWRAYIESQGAQISHLHYNCAMIFRFTFCLLPICMFEFVFSVFLYMYPVLIYGLCLSYLSADVYMYNKPIYFCLPSK